VQDSERKVHFVSLPAQVIGLNKCQVCTEAIATKRST
jgi:hypothetical protein